MYLSSMIAQTLSRSARFPEGLSDMHAWGEGGGGGGGDGRMRGVCVWGEGEGVAVAGGGYLRRMS